MHISNVSSNSATFTLTCGLEATSTLNYKLLNSSQVQSIALSCGTSLTLPLIPNTNYTLLREYGDETCAINDSFTTPQPGKQGSSFKGQLILAVHADNCALHGIFLCLMVYQISKMHSHVKYKK